MISPLAAIALAGALSAAVPLRIVTPADGALAVGEGWIEVETSVAAPDRVEIRVDGELAGVLRQPPYRLPFDFGSGERVRTISAEVYFDGYAGREATSVRTAPIAAVEALTVDWVEVPFRVAGRTAPERGTLRVLENGVEQQLRELRAERGPTRFVFVIDRSLSMEPAVLASALGSARELVPRFREGDSADVIFFNHVVSDPVALAVARDPSPAGGTALRDALAAIRPCSRTVAIVISDGGDRNSFLPADEALRTIAVGTLTVHALALDGGAGAEFLREVARRTGGSFRRSSAARMAGDLRALWSEIDARWVLAYQSSNEGKGWRAIEVRAPKGVRVESARPGYFAE